MKLAKAFLFLITMLSASVADSQGLVNFSNHPLLRPPERRVFDVNGTTPVSGINFVAQLLYEDNSGTWVAHPNIAQFFETSFLDLAGYWRGSGRSLVDAGGVPNPLDPTRALPVNLQVRVWDAGFDMTFPLAFDEAVLAGLKWGMSDVFVYVQEFDVPSGTDDTLMKNFQGFSLVPEPSVWALFALGMGWLVWRNRKGKS